jgi:hypothetical protein
MFRTTTQQPEGLGQRVQAGMSCFWANAPLGFKGGDTNLYRFVGNDPTNETDPSGCIGVFFDGTLMTAAHNTIIRQLFADYKGGMLLEFAVLGGAQVGPIGEGLTAGVTPIAALLREEGRDQARREFDLNVEVAFQLVKRLRKKDEPVDLFGYSRGAIAAVYLARKLKEENIPVRYMALVDPSVTYSGKDIPVIPDNVQAVSLLLSGTKRAHSVNEFGADWLIVSPCELTLESKRTALVIHRLDQDGHTSIGKSDRVSRLIRVEAGAMGVPVLPPPPRPPLAGEASPADPLEFLKKRQELNQPSLPVDY